MPSKFILRLTLCIWVAFISDLAHGITPVGVKESKARFSKHMAVSCPHSSDIHPCTCTHDGEDYIDINCSKVTSESELRRVFQHDHYHYRSLIIRNNSYIRSLHRGDFGEHVFEYIFISNTSITEIEHDALEDHHGTLQILDLWGNHLSRFVEISRFQHLTYLDLANNDFREFPELHSQSLQHLDLSNNSISDIEHVLIGLPSVRLLYLEGNHISEIHGETFSGHLHLEKLVLSNNRISRLDRGAIHLVGDASELDLDDNDLTHVTSGSISGITGKLFLRDNYLAELPESEFKPLLESNVKVYLDGNPFECGCDIAWLITDQTLVSQLTAYSNPTCTDGKAFADLDPAYYEKNC